MQSTIKLLVVSAFILPTSTLLHAQTKAPDAPATPQVLRLDAADVTYALGVSRQGELQTVYWGARLADHDPLPVPQPVGRAFEINDAPQEFAGWGGGLFAEPSLKITFPDGNRDLVLHYVSHTQEANRLTVQLKDIERSVGITLHYAIDPETGILARWADIQNNTPQPFVIEQAESAEWNLPSSSTYVLRYLSGRWAGEDQLHTRAVEPGETVLESRRGFTGHEFAPWFSVAENGAVSETDGRVWFGALAWSGSWRITIAQDPMQQLKITGGYNPFDFGYKLAVGETLTAPIFYGGYTSHGLGDMSRLESMFQRHSILPQAPAPRVRPVLYNSWEATEFNFDEHTQEQIADKAASIGVERFVMDDGWFSTRLKDNAGLGDWYPNPQRFPNGLKPLIDHVHSLGMDFGIWVEPEMVNQNSDLYRKHPDWILHFTGRPQTEARSQFVLNLAQPEVQQYLISFLDKLLRENDIAFLKWDANRNFSEPGWVQAPPDEQKKVWVSYTQGYYKVLAALRERFPRLEIESCSGGGGRVDLGVMHLTDEVWTSDNTDPLDRLSIQDGFTYAYTPQAMMAWVTDSPNWVNGRSSTLSYRFLSSMQGSLGIGADLNKWSSQDFALAKQLVADYKTIRPLVQEGTLYRLISPRDGSNVASTESAAADGSAAVVFEFLHSQQFKYPPPTVHPRGLHPRAIYAIRAIGGKLASHTPPTASGAFWMEHGIDFALQGDLDAAAALLTEAH